MRVLGLFLLCACATAAPEARLFFETGSPDAPARPSAGCAAPGAVVQGARRLTSSGRTRRFRLVVPERARPGPAPLVLNLHGLVETAAMQQLYSGMDEKAARLGIVTVYPEGAMNSWNAGGCCGRAHDENIDDVRFLRDLVRELESELCIDRARVYATGMSNGAMMSFRLACEASDVFAAVAPVEGVEEVPRCTPRRPVPVLAFNGTSDLLVHYQSSWYGLTSVMDTMAKLRARNRCSAEAPAVWQHGDALCEAARGCAADAIFCRIDGGGHTWPGAMAFPLLGHTSSDVDATATILSFFLAHPMSR